MIISAEKHIVRNIGGCFKDVGNPAMVISWHEISPSDFWDKTIFSNPVGSSQLRSRSSSPWGAWLFFLALVKMTIGPLILSADMLDFISIISVR